MYSSKLITAVFGIAVVCCLIACSDDTTIVQNINRGDQVRVSGELRAWKCGVRDGWNNLGDLRFGVVTKDTATITIVYPNGWRDTVYTDTLSRFERIVSKGLHQLIVETRYTWPDTFLVYFERDTIMNLDIVYDVLDASRVGLTFYYARASETLSVRQEWQILQRLNNRIENRLVIPTEMPPDVDRSSMKLEYIHLRVVTYRIPVISRRTRTLDVWRQGTAVLEEDTNHAISPVPLHIESPHYVCLAGG